MGMRYWKALGVWTLVLTGAVLAYSGLPALLRGDDLRLALAVSGVARVVGFLLPFVAFAAAARVAGSARRRTTRHLLLTGVLAYAAVAWADPVLQHHRRQAAPASDGALAEVLAQGPDTPKELLLRRDQIRQAPPERFSFRAQDRLAAPPNWIDFRLHSPVCLALFALLNGLLGVRLARRRPAGDVGAHWLWLLGLASAVAFLAPMMVAEALVMASTGTNGALAAWAPLAVPLAALSVVTGLTGRLSPSEDGVGPAPPGGRA